MLCDNGNQDGNCGIKRTRGPTTGTKILFADEFKSKGLKLNVSGQVVPTLPMKTSGWLMRGQGIYNGWVPAPSPATHQVTHRHSQTT